MELLPYQSSGSSPSATWPTIAPSRIAQSLRRRAEEQVVCAILHASSLYGLFALAASSIVWATQRTRSRFMAFQSLQALIFQLFIFLALLVLFALLMAGFFFAASSGLIARTGVTEPELTAFLIDAAILGFGCIHFFQWIFPLWGIWAAVKTLRGRNFRYPILGSLAAHWLVRRPVVIESVPANRESNGESLTGESTLAGLGHLSILGGLSPILVPILWATAKQRSQFLTYHLLQAALFQLLTMGIILTWLFVMLGLPLLFGWVGGLLPTAIFTAVTEITASPVFSSGCPGIMGILVLITGILALVAAIRAFKGKEFHYPVVGSWLANYLNREI